MSRRVAFSQVQVLKSAVESVDTMRSLCVLWPSVTMYHSDIHTPQYLHPFRLHVLLRRAFIRSFLYIHDFHNRDSKKKKHLPYWYSDGCDSCPAFFFPLHVLSFFLKVRRCVKLNVPDNGYIKCSGDGNNYGATCEFSCIGGYELQGSPARVCQYNLGWSGVEPTCARKWVFRCFTERATMVLTEVRIGEEAWGQIQLHTLMPFR